jgi:hypothetical protein
VNGLSLRTNVTNPNGQDGTLFTVSTSATFDDAFTELSNYLTGDPAYGILAFILSVQYCAANLNTTCGPLAGNTLFIDQLGDQVLVPFGTMAANTLALLSDPRSANTGPDGDQEWRAVIMGCLSEWEDMNGNGQNIHTPSRSPESFASPY